MLYIYIYIYVLSIIVYCIVVIHCDRLYSVALSSARGYGALCTGRPTNGESLLWVLGGVDGSGVLGSEV